MRKTGNFAFRRAATKQRQPTPMADARRPDVDGESVRTSFGANFHACRKQLQLSPGVIHELTGVPASHIAQIEAGQGSLRLHCNFPVCFRDPALSTADRWSSHGTPGSRR